MSAVSEKDFQQSVVQAHKPILVHFAGGGATDKALQPVLEALAARLGVRSRVARVELAPNAGIAAKYGVTAAGLVYFREGRVAGRAPEESTDAETLFAWLEGMGIGCACHPD